MYFTFLILLIFGWLLARPLLLERSFATMSAQLLCVSMIGLVDHNLRAYNWWNSTRIVILGGSILLAVIAVGRGFDQSLGLLHRLDPRTWKSPIAGRDAAVTLGALSILGTTMLVAAASSGEFAKTAPLTLRWLATIGVAVLLASALPTLLSRRILAEFLGLYVLSLTAAVVLVPGRAFPTVRAPLIDRALLAPHITKASDVGLVGFGLIVVGLASRGKIRILALATGATTLLLSQRRGLVVATVALAFVWTFTLAKRQQVMILAAGLLIALIGAIGPGRDVWDREQVHPEAANITSYRRAIFDEALERFETSPIVGHGLGVQDRGLLISVGQPGIAWSTHSEPGTALVSSGMIGVLALIVVYASSFRQALARFRRESDWLPLAIVLAMLITTPVVAWISRTSPLSLPFLFVVLPLAFAPASTPTPATPTPEPDRSRI